jgi:hypothetical protein
MAKNGCHGGHLGYRTALTDTILKRDHPRIISAKFGWDWLSSFRGEDFFLIRLCKLEKRGDEIKKILLLWNYWANLNQNLLKWSLGGPFSKLCPSEPSWNRVVFGHLKKFLFLVMAAILDTRPCWRTPFWKGTTQGSFQQSLVEIGSVVILRDFLWALNFCLFWPIMQIRKKGGWHLKKIFSSETTEPISTKLCWNDPWVVPFQKCVHQSRPVSKMAAITKNRNFFKWPKRCNWPSGFWGEDFYVNFP